MLKTLFKKQNYAKDANGNKIEVEILPAGWTFEQEQEKQKEEYMKDYYKKKRNIERKNFGIDISYALVASVTKLGLLFFFTWLILFIYAGFAYFVWNVVLHNIIGLTTISFTGAYGFCLLLTALGGNIKNQVKNLRPSKEKSEWLELAQEYEKLLMDVLFELFIHLGFGPLGFFIFWDEFLYKFAKFEKPSYFVVVVGFLIVKSILNYIKSFKKETN